MRFDASKYVTVQDRINQFWKDNPEGRIETQLASMPSDFERALYRAEVYRNVADAKPAATGYSMAIAGTGGANNTAWHENAETSAIGRALANMGYATSLETRPSLEEMQKSADMAAGPAPARPAPAPPSERSKPLNPNSAAPVNQPTEKQLWLANKLIAESGLPPMKAFALLPEFAEHPEGITLAKLDKFQVSKLIETLKIRAEVQQGEKPLHQPGPKGMLGDPYDDAPEPVQPDDEVPF